MISCTALNGKTVLALLTVDGFLAACSIIQRVNTADAVPMTPTAAAAHAQQGRHSVMPCSLVRSQGSVLAKF